MDKHLKPPFAKPPVDFPDREIRVKRSHNIAELITFRITKAKARVSR